MGAIRMLLTVFSLVLVIIMQKAVPASCPSSSVVAIEAVEAIEAAVAVLAVVAIVTGTS